MERTMMANSTPMMGLKLGKTGPDQKFWSFFYQVTSEKERVEGSG